MTVSGTITVRPELTHTPSSIGAANSVSEIITDAFSQAIADGSGDGQMNALYQAERNLGATTSENLDLYGGLTNSFGTTMNFATVKLIIVINDTVGDLYVGGGNFSAILNGGTTDEIVIKAGGTLVLVAPNTGYTVTDSSADLLKIENAAGSAIDYQIIIGGTA